MKEFDPRREFLFDYITVVAESTLAFAVIGSIFAGDVSISFVWFFFPFLFGLICMLPCIPIYLKEDMTVKQIMIQRIVELLVLEAAMYASVWYMMGEKLSTAGYIAVLSVTAFLDVLSYMIKWYLEKEEADKINRRLQEHKKRVG